MNEIILSKKVELESEGYSFYSDTNEASENDGTLIETYFIETPDGWILEYGDFPEAEQDAIDKAYSHFQERKKMEALESFVSGIIQLRKKEFTKDYQVVTYVDYEGNRLIQEFNIQLEEPE